MKRNAKLEKFDASLLLVDRTVNFRDDYDVPSMVELIYSAGKVIEPIHVLKPQKDGDPFTVLRGNRRVSAAQVILNDPKAPTELKDALKKIEGYVWSDFSERELTEFVLDHGGQKPLSRVEIVKAVRRLIKQMLSEKEIASLMFHQLSRFTGNAQKAYEASQIPAGPQRDEFVRKWLHGTLGNFIMPVSGMGEEVWSQYILTETNNDRALTKDEESQRTFDCNREAVKLLTTAKKKDKEGKGWDTQTGGEEFNKQLSELKAAYGKPKTKVDRFTSEQMIAAADNMQSSGMRMAYLGCAGKLSAADKAQIDSLDTEYSRRDKVMPLLQSQLERITDPNVKTLLDAILNKTDKDVQSALMPFLPTSAE